MVPIDSPQFRDVIGVYMQQPRIVKLPIPSPVNSYEGGHHCMHITKALGSFRLSYYSLKLQCMCVCVCAVGKEPGLVTNKNIYFHVMVIKFMWVSKRQLHGVWSL